MKIEAYNEHINMMEKLFNDTEIKEKVSSENSIKFSAAAVFNKSVNSSLFGRTNYSKDEKEEMLSKEDIMAEAESLADNFKAMCNKMDLGEVVALDDAGVKVEDTDIRELVTVAKQMRIKMAAAGNRRVYTGDIDAADIEAVMGNEALTASVISSFRKNSYPVTEANVTEAVMAYDKYESLTETDSSSRAYMMKNYMTPTIDNLYTSEHAGLLDYTKEDLPDEMWADIKPQIESIMDKAGVDINSETLSDMRLFLGFHIPVTEDNMKIYGDILKADEIIRNDSFSVDQITYAMIEGERAEDTVVSDGEPAFMLAYEAVDTLSKADVSNHRMLSELRLKLTFEAAYVLEKNNIHVNTTELSELVEELRKLENSMSETESITQEASTISPGEVMENIEYLKGAPADAFGSAVYTPYVSISSLTGAAVAAERTYAVAAKSYETMSTQFRPDLGDTIDRAVVASMDSILDELKLERTPENERAIRILAHNSIEITYENLEKVKAVDSDMNEIFRRMTGRNAEALLDAGEDVMGMDIHELLTVLKEMPADGREEKKCLRDFARVVYENKNTSKMDEEKSELFTGLYTVLRKLLTDDGLAIGSMVKQGMDINLSNMVSAYLTRKDAGIDTQAGDESTTKHISSKVLYYKELLEAAGKVSEGALCMLEENDVPGTLNNMITGGMLFEDPSFVYGGLKGSGIDISLERFLSKFDSKKLLKEDIKKLSDETAEYVKSSEEGERLDIDVLRQIGSGMSMLNSMAEHNTFYLPYEEEGNVSVIRLSLVEDSENRGSFSIDMEHPALGNISIHGNVTSESINASIVCDSDLELNGVEEKLVEIGFKNVKIAVSKSSLHPNFPSGQPSEVETGKIFKAAKVFIENCR